MNIDFKIKEGTEYNKLASIAAEKVFSMKTAGSKTSLLIEQNGITKDELKKLLTDLKPVDPNVKNIDTYIKNEENNDVIHFIGVRISFHNVIALLERGHKEQETKDDTKTIMEIEPSTSLSEPESMYVLDIKDRRRCLITELMAEQLQDKLKEGFNNINLRDGNNFVRVGDPCEIFSCTKAVRDPRTGLFII